MKLYYSFSLNFEYPKQKKTSLTWFWNWNCHTLTEHKPNTQVPQFIRTKKREEEEEENNLPDACVEWWMREQACGRKGSESYWEINQQWWSEKKR